MPRTSTMENTAPSTKEISFARYRVGTDRDAAVPPWSRMAVFMIAIDRTRVAAPQIAPHFASFLLLAVIPRAVKYVLPLRKLRDRYKTELTIQLGDGRSPASAVPYSPAWVMFPKSRITVTTPTNKVNTIITGPMADTIRIRRSNPTRYAPKTRADIIREPIYRFSP